MVAGRTDHRRFARVSDETGEFTLADTDGHYSDSDRGLWRDGLRATIPAYRAQGFGRLDRRDAENRAQPGVPALDRMHDDHGLNRARAGADGELGVGENRRNGRNFDPGLWQRVDVRLAIFRRADRAQNFSHRNDVGVGGSGGDRTISAG